MIETVGGTAAVPRSVIEDMDFEGKSIAISAKGSELLISIVKDEDETEI